MKFLLMSLCSLMIFSSCSSKKRTYSDIPDARQSPWEHQGEEFAHGAKITTPIIYKNLFERERDLLGYNPRYYPNAIDFDHNNRPFMRFGPQGELGDHKSKYNKRSYQKENFIQTLNKEGQWQVIDSQRVFLRKHFALTESDELTIRTGISVPERLVFDKNNRVYTIVDVTYKKNNKKSHTSVVLSSNDFHKWTIVDLKGFYPVRLEYFVGQNDLQSIVVRGKDNRKDAIKLIAIDSLNSSEAFYFQSIGELKTNKLAFNTDMAGCGNDFVTLANKTYFVYMIQEAYKDVQESAHFLQVFDHQKLQFEAPQFLGYSGHSVDLHNTPAISADKEGYIHIVLGAHWNSFVYLKSKAPQSSVFEKADYIAGNGNNDWSRDGLTYIALQIDKQGTLHLVARGRGKYSDQTPDYLDYALQYFRKKKDGNWEARKNLVVPNYKNYGNWYHRLSQDRKGRLFLQYVHYIAKMSDEQLKLYKQRWPREEISKDKGSHAGVSAHDPVLLISDDAGDTWRLMKSEDLQQ